ncbi:MAG TPA: M18 family aminopeptidase [Rectinemataceae bacterium]
MDRIESLCGFIDASPTAFHAADSIVARLEAHGARALDEAAAWKLEPGESRYLVRGSNSVIAFRLGSGSPGDWGFALAGAHTDSPALKARPRGERAEKGLLRVAVDVYGGAILSSWLDRPLWLAGRALVKTEQGLSSRLFRSPKALGLVPNNAIHLNREINKGFEYNPHSHLPVLVEALGSPVVGSSAAAGRARPDWLSERVAEELGVQAEAIAAFEAFFYDGQGPVVFGASGGSPPLVNAPRLDDLSGCYAILEAFCEAKPSRATQVACFLEAEEIGSMTAQGANSSFLRDVLARIVLGAGCPPEDFYRAIPRSLCISLDAAQGLNPPYSDKMDDLFTPRLGAGPALKKSAARRYATELESEALFERLCDSAGIPRQVYMAKADSQPGTTIGPLTSSRLGFKTMDVGQPLLSMHAVRETIAWSDTRASAGLVAALYSGAVELMA